MGNIKNLEETFKAISTWGTAVEEGRNSDAELSVLKTMLEQDPILFIDALQAAESFQEMAAQDLVSSDLPRTAPSHPVQRFERIQTLAKLLGLDDEDNTPVYGFPAFG